MAQTVKNLPAVWETWVLFLGQEDPWRRERLPTPVFLPGESHGQRSLVGCRAWGCKELDVTEQLGMHRLIIVHILMTVSQGSEWLSKLPQL